MNKQLFKLLNTVEKEYNLSEENFLKILEQYEVAESEFRKEQNESLEVGGTNQDNNWLELRKEVFNKRERNYFTISSKQDFNGLVGDNSEEWKHILIYHPLNNHSREHLKKGDILFCYRQGQFGSLGEALEIRGIYGIGVAVSNPLVLFPDEEDYKQYGVIVAFPILLEKHLQLRNIQMHPNTIDLTPYNGNRNDALQHIPDERHYSTLLSLLMQANVNLKKDIEYLFDIKVDEVTLPDEQWKSSTSTPSFDEDDIEFDIDLFVNSLSDAGLIYNRELVLRFIAALCTKPFVILTGLSGSGKTQLALNFARWITRDSKSYYKILKKALKSEILNKYEVISISEDIVQLTNQGGSSKKIIPLPTKVIYEWYDAMREKIISSDDDPKETRHIIGESSTYQKYIHGFYNELSKLAKAMIEVSEEQADETILKQFTIIPVGADWTNREPLLGYPNALKSDSYIKPDNGVIDILINAKENPELPFFIILDEMNLSHVERYFSDFLSVIETGEPIMLYDESESRSEVSPKVSWPSNLFIIGTVNIDETTYMFSPKVLDRANTIEFRVNKENMYEFLSNSKNVYIEKLIGQGYHTARSFLEIAKEDSSLNNSNDEYKETLIEFFKELSVVGAEFGFRTATEIYRLINKLGAIDNTLDNNAKMDIAIMQKLLPKLHGSRRKLCPVLIALAKLCVSKKIDDIDKELIEKENINYKEVEYVKYPLSMDKISRMYKNAVDNGFASYAEA